MPPRTLLITGATGKQGSAVIDAFLSHPLSSSDPFTVLASLKENRSSTTPSKTTSVDRGGDEHSWNNPTDVPHFKSKWEVEHYLRKSATRTLGWTILRPVIFMDNLSPGFAGKVFMTLLRDTLGRDKPLQWIATRDIGFFAAEAFHNPEEWNKKAMVFERVTGKPVPTTWGLLGKGLKTGVKELGSMVEWFASEEYRADLRKVKEVNPGMVGLEEWLRKSPFVKGK
ncbi:uncharacterized protein QC761_0027180 [Podospora bellae-mahoneyi]|uniref:NmrA-like domain-containing protein n=1 Tax=Podospora bellae-mahoneyi TaxID=2093777 RepID=A0ABR0FW18_9PEZI|nr:hypothetical protein QC761_0027180 [Podospora bellae-mahoneyi]